MLTPSRYQSSVLWNTCPLESDAIAAAPTRFTVRPSPIGLACPSRSTRPNGSDLRISKACEARNAFDSIFYSRRIQEVLFVCFTRYGYSSSCPMLGASDAVDVVTVALTPELAVEAVVESARAHCSPDAKRAQGRLNLSTRKCFLCKPTIS